MQLLRGLLETLIKIESMKHKNYIHFIDTSDGWKKERAKKNTHNFCRYNNKNQTINLTV